MSRRKVDAVRQSWRSGEGEGRGRVSGLLHCLFTLIDDGPHTAGAAADGLNPSQTGAARHAAARTGNRGKETRWGRENGWLQLLPSDSSCGKPRRLGSPRRGVAGALLSSLCRSCRPGDPNHLQPALHGSPQRIPGRHLTSSAHSLSHTLLTPSLAAGVRTPPPPPVSTTTTAARCRLYNRPLYLPHYKATPWPSLLLLSPPVPRTGSPDTWGPYPAGYTHRSSAHKNTRRGNSRPLSSGGARFKAINKLLSLGNSDLCTWRECTCIHLGPPAVPSRICEPQTTLPPAHRPASASLLLL